MESHQDQPLVQEDLETETERESEWLVERERERDLPNTLMKRGSERELERFASLNARHCT